MNAPSRTLSFSNSSKKKKKVKTIKKTKQKKKEEKQIKKKKKIKYNSHLVPAPKHPLDTYDQTRLQPI